ncbi:AI-2E family transporter [Salirhabdus sp. Marseille-P4669]|uniref:AI-2E family transporter n=1 Tax=Salirhabdus sp. Marseille-P4669 TaxID=2042310 RepID=UPI000C7BBFEA|nr:AI-2E family transporter [Salirhabdus sp. Marseille-P4669]
MNESQRKLLYWLLIALISLILCYLLWISFPFYNFIFSFLLAVLTPVLISALIAYILYPIIEMLEQIIPRWFAIFIIYLLIFGGIIFGISKAYPVFVHQLQELIHNLPTLIQTYQEWIYNLYIQTSRFPETVHDQMDSAFATIENKLMQILTNTIYSLTGITDVLVIAAVIPILVFYFLKDFPKIKAACTAIVPEKRKFQEYLRQLDKSLGGYLRGQLLVCLFVAVISTMLLWLISMKYPLILGLFMGVTNIIPYFGPILGAIPAVIIAFTISSQRVIFVVGVVIVVQLIESNLLSPYIVGRSLHVHPVLIILALLIGAEAFGIVGMILAVPMLTIAKVFIEPTHIIKKMKKAWYKTN